MCSIFYSWCCTLLLRKMVRSLRRRRCRNKIKSLFFYHLDPFRSHTISLLTSTDYGPSFKRRLSDSTIQLQLVNSVAMNPDQRILITRCKRQQDNLLCWSAHMNAAWKTKHAWHAARSGDAASPFGSHQGGTKRADTVSGRFVDERYARDIACSVIIHLPGGVCSAFSVTHQDDLGRMWELLHQQYRSNTTFSKTVL